jgi:UDP-N-acetylglucosamine transferase subunit ALG13
VIFLTIGTHEPFDRLLRVVDGWVGARKNGTAEVFGQITDPGAGGYRPRHFRWVTRMSPADYDARVAEADFLIAHAGMGSIITAMRHSKPIVILPRRGSLRETRNDHQFYTAAKLGGKPGIFVAMDEAALLPLLDDLVTRAGEVRVETAGRHAQERLLEALRGLIHGPVPARRGRRPAD